MPSFAHIINPFSAPPGSEHAIAQPITFASILRAHKEASGKVMVQLLAVRAVGDPVEIPSEFRILADLQKSIHDVGVSSGRKLPLLAELLDRVKNVDADYIIFSNADIGVMPGFYLMCDHFASKNYDAFVINRRRIPAKYVSPDQLEEIYAEAGEIHTGYDTLVFKKELLQKFVLGNVAIGVPYHDTVLVHNLYAFATNFRLFTGKHLTFHIGMQLVKEWGNKEQYRHNRRELLVTLKILRPHFRIENFPGASLGFFKRHFIWLMNPTFHYPLMFSLDLSQGSHKRRKYPKDGREKQKYLNWMIRKVNFPEDE